MRRTVTALAGLALALTACGQETASDTPTDNGTETTAAPSPTTTESPTPAPQPTSAPTTPSSGDVAMGETFTWDDGVSVTLSEPEQTTTDGGGAGDGEYDNHIAVTVRIENGGDDTVDTAAIYFWPDEGTRIFYTAEGYGGFHDSVSPGDSFEGDALFGIADPDSFTMEVQREFGTDLPPATFVWG